MFASGVYQCLADVMIVNKKGLHARASMAFVKCVENFDADVTVRKDDASVNGNSIMGLLMLNAGPGTQLTLETEGPEAEELLDALTVLIEQCFNEAE
jgi:phosphocarrier protein